MNIPDDVIDAAARAIHEQVYGPDWWEQDTCAHPARRAEARAALSAALPLLALDRDGIARAIEESIPEDIPGWRFRYSERAADAVIAASPLRSVTEVREQIAAEMDALAQREREAVEYERSYGGRGGRLGMHASRIGAFEDAARIALTAKRVSVGSRNGGAS